VCTDTGSSTCAQQAATAAEAGEGFSCWCCWTASSGMSESNGCCYGPPGLSWPGTQRMSKLQCTPLAGALAVCIYAGSVSCKHASVPCTLPPCAVLPELWLIKRQSSLRHPVLCMLLQNADDAKATTVKFCLDYNTYPAGALCVSTDSRQTTQRAK
jgi:hypothetical protein